MPSSANTVIASYVQTLLRVLSDLGIDSNLLDTHEILSADANGRIAVSSVTHLWIQAVELTKDPSLGLRVAEKIHPGSFHVLGQLVLHCSNLQQAFEFVHKYQSLVTQAGNLELTQLDDDGLALDITVAVQTPAIIPQQIEALLGATVILTRLVMQGDFAPQEVWFSSASTGDDELYNRIFQCPVLFNQPCNRIAIDQQQLSRSIPHAAADLLKHHESLAQQKLADCNNQIEESAEPILSTATNSVTNIAVTYLNTFTAAAVAKGLDTQTLLQQAGVDSSLLADSNNQIPFDQLLDFVWLVIKTSGDDNFGIDAGDPPRPSNWGMLTLVMLNSSTLKIAMEYAIQYEHLFNGAIKTTLEYQGDLARVNTEFPGYDDEKIRPFVEQDFVAFMQFGKFLIDSSGIGNSETALKEVTFRHQQPANPERCQEFFQVPIIYNAPCNSLLVEKSVFDLPIPTANAKLLEVLLVQIEELNARQSEQDNFSAKVYFYIKDHLATGVPTLEQAAQHFGISLSTLKRRLQQEETSYKQVSNQVRQQVTFDLLENTNQPIADIAYLVGFKNPTTFYRAFKEWTGKTPAYFRKTTY